MRDERKTAQRSTAEWQAADAAHFLHPFTDFGALAQKGSRIIEKGEGIYLWDSDGHTFDYVEKMLRELFGHQKEECEKIAKEVDADGKAVVLTTTREHAELKRDQIHAYGKDNLEGSKGSMWSTIEPVE